MADTAVVVNEFGEIGLDHLLLEASPDEVVLLGSGCICCAVRQDLVRTLYSLLARRAEGSVPPFRRIAIETSGLAEPAPILATLASDARLEATLRLAGVLTLVDCVAGLATLDRHAEATAQAVVADRLLLTKADLVAPSMALLERLAAINPGAEVVIPASPSVIPAKAGTHAANNDGRAAWSPAFAGVTKKRACSDPAALLFSRSSAAPRRTLFAAPTRHTHGIASFTVRLRAEMTRLDFAKALGGLARARGEDLLRVKGIVRFADRPDRPAVIHAVQHTLYPPEWLDDAPAGAIVNRLVFIVRAIPVERVLACFAAGAPAASD
jgi:G3E family GTPase